MWPWRRAVLSWWEWGRWNGKPWAAVKEGCCWVELRLESMREDVALMSEL
jgi:hypothetical protein